jgi:hypothetical protein
MKLGWNEENRKLLLPWCSSEKQKQVRSMLIGALDIRIEVEVCSSPAPMSIKTSSVEIGFCETVVYFRYPSQSSLTQKSKGFGLRKRNPMRFTIGILVAALLFIPFQPVSAGPSVPGTVIILTADQVESAIDIEAAIISATAQGNRPGTVILDGRKGAFVLSGSDRSINIFVSNLILRGIHGAVIKDCGDGLFFDDFPLRHILVEGIMFLCSGDGVAASGTFRDVILRDNQFNVMNYGIGAAGHSSNWLIAGNLIQSGWDGIRLTGVENVAITGNHLSGSIGIVLMQTSHSQVRRNAISADYQGVLLGQESVHNTVRANSIMGVSAAGIALELGVTGNRIVANYVLCAPETDCLTVDAVPEVAEANTILANQP